MSCSFEIKLLLSCSAVPIDYYHYYYYYHHTTTPLLTPEFYSLLRLRMRSATGKSTKKSSKVAKAKNLLLDVAVEIPPTVENAGGRTSVPTVSEEQDAALLGLHRDLDSMLASTSGLLDSNALPPLLSETPSSNPEPQHSMSEIDVIDLTGEDIEDPNNGAPPASPVYIDLTAADLNYAIDDWFSAAAQEGRYAPPSSPQTTTLPPDVVVRDSEGHVITPSQHESVILINGEASVVTDSYSSTVVGDTSGEVNPRQVLAKLTPTSTTKRAASPQLHPEATEKKKKRKYTKSQATVTAAAARSAKGGVASATFPSPTATAAATPTQLKNTSKKAGSKLANFRVVPLTSDKWPARFGFPTQQKAGSIVPDQLFYPPGDTSTLIEVYKLPFIAGVSIRQYLNKPYERRVNLRANDFRGLFYQGKAIIENYERITEDAKKGAPTVQNYLNYLDNPVKHTGVLVNLYRGQAKIHIGTASYIVEMDQALPPGRAATSPAHCGHTITLNTIKDIVERVGPLVEDDTSFYRGVTTCDGA